MKFILILQFCAITGAIFSLHQDKNMKKDIDRASILRMRLIAKLLFVVDLLLTIYGWTAI